MRHLGKMSTAPVASVKVASPSSLQHLQKAPSAGNRMQALRRGQPPLLDPP